MAKLLTGTRIYGTATIDTQFFVNGTTSATSTTTGALQVVGGVGIQGDIYARNLYSNGVLIGTSAGNATTATNLAAGTAGQVPYQTGPGLTSFFGPGTAGNVLVSNGTGAPAYQNTLTLTGTTAASSTTTGALQVVGGVGIGGAAWASNVVAVNTISNGLNLANFVARPNGTTSSQRTGMAFYGTFFNFPSDLGPRRSADIISGFASGTWGTEYLSFNVGNGGTPNDSNLITTEQVRISSSSVTLSSTATSTSTTTGALIVPGGVGIGGNLYVGGEIVASKLTIQLTTVTTTLVNTDDIISTYNTTPVNSTNTGALRIGGGIGVAGGGFFGGIVTATTFVGNLTGTATTATSLGGGTAMSLPYQSAANTTAFLAAGSSGQILQTNGTGSAPTWVSVSGLSAGNASTATNIAGGTAGQVPYQASPGITSFFGPGTAGNILVSNGTSAPAYQSTLTLAGITTSSSTNTGALQVVGGAGIGGNLNVGGTVTVGSGAATVSSSNGDLTLIAVGGNVTTTNVVIISNTTSVNSTVTGALRIAGGVGVGGGGFFGGLVTATNFFVGPWAVSTASALTIQSNGVSQGTAGTLNFTSGTAVAVTGSIATVWVNTNTLMTTAVNLNGGVQYQIPYQQSTGTTVFILPPPTSQNSLLQFTTGTGFTWTNTTTVGGGTFFYSPIVDTFTSVGTTTTYTLSTAPTSKNILTVVVDGVTQLQSTFSLSGTSLIFSEIPYNGANIDVHYANVLSTSTTPAAGIPGQIQYNWNGITSGTTLMSYNSSTGVVGIASTVASSSTITGALTVVGGIGIGGGGVFGGTVTATNFVGSFSGTITGTATTATNLAGGTAGQIHYQSAPGVTAFAGPGSFGQFLMSNGTGAPLYQSTLTQSNGNIIVSGNTSATSTTTGALQVVGGVGVGGNLFISGSTPGDGGTNNGTGSLVYIKQNTTWGGAQPWALYVSGYSYMGGFRINGADGPRALFLQSGQLGFATGDGVSPITFTSNNTTERMRIDTNGIVYINTTTQFSGAILNVVGGVFVTGTVTATTFVGNLTGTATNATTATNLAGGTANQFAFQTGPGATSFISTGSMYVNRAVIADSASGSSAQVNTIAQTANANYFLTFVDANNASTAAETVYTTSTFYVNPRTGVVSATQYSSIDSTLSPSSNAGVQVVNGSTSMNFIAYTAGGSYNPTTQAGDSLFMWRGVGQGNSGALNIAPWSTTATGIRITTAGVTTIASTVSTFSTTTGALVVGGGAGIAGGLVVGGTVTATNMILNGYQVSTSSALTIQGYGTSLGTASTLNFSTGTTATVVGGVATIQALGAVVSVTGGTDTVATSVSGAVTVWNTSTLQSITNRGATTTNVINITNATAGSSTITGALVVTGGIGIGGNFYTSGIQRITNSTAASSTTTGALVVTGGVGIGGSLYAGNIFTNGSQVLPTNIQEITATGGQATFTITGGYTIGSLQVFANGVNLGSGDYTATNGTTVVVAVPRAGGDVMRFVSAQTSSSINNINSLAIAYSVAFGG